MAARKSKTSYAYAIIGIWLVLCVLGTLGWLLINARGLSRLFKEDIEVSVEFHDNTREDNIFKMRDILKQQGFAREVRYISKEEALKMQTIQEGEDISQMVDVNPLYSSLVLKLYAPYINRDSLEKIRAFCLQSNIVRDVVYPKVVVEKINANIRKVGLIMGAVSLLLISIVIILIDNTVKLAMFSNRFLIKTMQMVGATRWFISKPFDQRAVINGLIGGGLAVAVLFILMRLAESWFPSLQDLHDPLLMGLLMAGMILIGIVMSVVSTHRSVIKYLKLQIEDLY